MLFSVLFFGATACANNDVRIEVKDSGQFLTIRAKKGNIDFEREYNVNGMSKSERKKLTDRVLDSLGVNK